MENIYPWERLTKLKYNFINFLLFVFQDWEEGHREGGHSHWGDRESEGGEGLTQGGD